MYHIFFTLPTPSISAASYNERRIDGAHRSQVNDAVPSDALPDSGKGINRAEQIRVPEKDE